MKSKHLLIGLSIMLLSLAPQISKAQSIDLGIKAGANFSSLSDASSLSNKTGVTAGAFAAVRFNMFSVQAELLYSEQGAEAGFGDIKLSYVQVPVLAKIHFLRLFNFQVGPQFGFLTNDNLPSGKAKDADFSLVAGVGLHLGSFRVDARYNFGLTKTISEIQDIGDVNSKNKYFSLALGYSFL
ncbi:MAG: porin family protein [Flavobacteriaceae bacterium]|nr:PorT family protein [Psychroflexus sp.]